MVGISFLGKKVLFAQHRDEHGEKILQIVGQIELPSFPDLEYIQRSNFRLDMVELLGKIKNVLRFPDRQSASVSLPSNWLHYYLVSIEPGLDVDMKREFLTWEFNQRTGEAGTALKPKFYTIHSSQGKEQVLIVGVPDTLTEVFTQVAHRVHFTLKVIDIDLLAVLETIPELTKKQFVCKFTKETVSIAETYDGELSAIAQFVRKSETTLEYSRGTVNSKYAKNLETKIVRLMNADKSTDDSVWIYGSDIPSSVQSLIQSLDTVNVIHPFHGFNVQSGAAKGMSLLEACEFSEVAGVIQRGTQNLA